MAFYIRDVRKCGDDTTRKRSLPPFYHVLARWNENGTRNQVSTDPKPTSLSVMQQDSQWWLLQSVGYMLISIPIMSFFDGLLRVCQLPPDTDTIPYWYRFPPPWQTLAYHLVAGFTLHLHVWIVEMFYRLFLTVRLFATLFWKRQVSHYQETRQFVTQPAIFDHPWLAHSAYNLWSVRWHQIFRPGFIKLAYQPVRSYFPSAWGRVVGTMAVFLASGLLHDYILVTMMGYSAIRTYPGMLGQQTMFFILQGVASVVSAPGAPWSNAWARMPMWLARLLTLVWIVYTAPIFVDPFLRIGLHKEAEVPLYPRSFDPYIGFLCPYGSISV
ncbi:membrane bound O-acyl transferase family-domain-containing protein [Chlamydoabsidia padenii]|nr:membrane bound O-acyl transferase family-domain-containing protein [Chlamydoabsidia padenii]